MLRLSAHLPIGHYLKKRFCGLAIDAGPYLVKNGNDHTSQNITKEKPKTSVSKESPEDEMILLLKRKSRKSGIVIEASCTDKVEIEDWDDSKSELDVKAKSQEDINRGISLILERKDELISFEQHLRFIFSYLGLREGWNNQNYIVIIIVLMF